MDNLKLGDYILAGKAIALFVRVLGFILVWYNNDVVTAMGVWIMVSGLLYRKDIIDTMRWHYVKRLANRDDKIE